MNAARSAITSGGRELISLQAVEGDWHALRELALWLFHTPPGAVPNLAPDTPPPPSTTHPRRRGRCRGVASRRESD